MPRRKAPENMSVEELRRLLIEKRRGARRERLEHFKRTGRVVDIAPDVLAESAPVVDTLEETTDQPQVPVSRRRRVMDRVLLAVEVLAVVGLVGVLISGFGILRDLNDGVARDPRQDRSREVGRVDDVIRKYADQWFADPAQGMAHLCGHPSMIEHGKAILGRRGWAKKPVPPSPSSRRRANGP